MSTSNVPQAPAETDLWHQHERLIRQLYQKERKTLEEVKQTMEAVHAFPKKP